MMPGWTMAGPVGQAAMPGLEMMDLHQRMMADPVIQQRVMADSAMRRLMSSGTRTPSTAPTAGAHQGHSMRAAAGAPRL